MKIETNLNKYSKASKIFKEELSNGMYNFIEAQEQCCKLWNLIPSYVQVNPYGLNTLMKERFENDPNYSRSYSKKFKIDGRSNFVNNEIIADIMRKKKKDLHN